VVGTEDISEAQLIEGNGFLTVFRNKGSYKTEDYACYWWCI